MYLCNESNWIAIINLILIKNYVIPNSLLFFQVPVRNYFHLQIPKYMCVCAHICVFLCIHMHMYVPCMPCVQVRGKPQALFSVTIYHFFFFEIDLELTKWAMVSGIPPTSISQRWDHKGVPSFPDF